MSDRKQKFTRRGVLIAGIAGITGVAAGSTIKTEIFPTVAVSYGEATFTSSDVIVADYQTTGPGINVTGVDVDLENTGSSDTTVTVDVFLMDGDTEQRSASTTTTVTAGNTTTVSVTVNQIRENQFDNIEIRVTES